MAWSSRIRGLRCGEAEGQALPMEPRCPPEYDVQERSRDAPQAAMALVMERGWRGHQPGSDECHGEEATEIRQSPTTGDLWCCAMGAGRKEEWEQAIS